MTSTRPWAERARASLPATWGPILIVLALVAAGFALTTWVFYPGVVNYDARYIHGYAMRGEYGDWQSPAMVATWALIDPLDPGPGSMFLFIASIYWLAFAVLALTMSRRSLWRSVALILLALSPPAFIFVGMIWRDVLFACTWLSAAALVLAVAEKPKGILIPAQALAVALLAFGVLLRPNAVAAAPILATFLIWPRQFSWQRAAILFVPLALAGVALIQVSYYGIFGAKREHPQQSLMVFDLGGITHFTKQNQFPGSWTPEEEAMLVDRCYQPVEWNSYWTYEPCDFVMNRLESAKIFGSPTIVSAWWEAVTNHPIAYLYHRIAFMWTFLTDANLTMWTQDLDDPSKTAFAENPALMTLKAVDEAISATPLLRAGTWLLLCAIVGLFGWRRRDTPAGAFVIGVCGSAVVYVLTFSALGVAADFRYAYWTVLAGLASLVIIWPPSSRDRPLSPAAHPLT